MSSSVCAGLPTWLKTTPSREHPDPRPLSFAKARPLPERALQAGDATQRQHAAQARRRGTLLYSKSVGAAWHAVHRAHAPREYPERGSCPKNGQTNTPTGHARVTVHDHLPSLSLFSSRLLPDDHSKSASSCCLPGTRLLRGSMANTLGRPAPPGRARGGQSRSISSYSLNRQTPPRSPLATTSVLPDQTEATGLGLETNGGTEDTATHEIPLEDVENALRDLTRDDLVLALKRAKEQMDILDAKLDASVERNEALEVTLAEYATQVNTLDGDKDSLQFALSHREERIDELMREQERNEHEVYLKAQVNERLRKQLDESERARADAERRYADQSSTSDKERQSYLDMEKLLQAQKAKASAALERAQASNQQLSRQNDRLQQKLAQHQHSSPLRPEVTQETDDGAQNDHPTVDTGPLVEDDRESSADTPPQSSHSTVVAKSLYAEQSSSELESLRNEFVTLQTSHTSLTATIQHLQAELRDFKAANADLRTQNETFVDLLQEKTINGELITESAMLNRRYSTIDSSEASSETGTTEASEAEDDVPDVPTKKSRGIQSRRRELKAQASREMLNVPRNLASELEKSEPDEEQRETRRRERTRERSEALGNNVEELQKEIWDLRDANQALTLYVTKILDRIISREGYENVLAIDADQKRTLRNKASRIRPGLPADASPDKTATQSAQSQAAFLGIGRSQGPTSPGSPRTPTANSSGFHSKAKRSASIDWRSFLPSVGGSAQSPPSATGASVQGSASGGEARRIRSSQEIEDKHDEEVREQIRQNMIRQGIVPPENQLKSQKRASTGLGTFFSRVIGSSETPKAADPLLVERGEQHPGPRVTTFDGDTRGPLSMAKTRSDAGSMASEGSNSPLSRLDMRQRALEQGGSGTLTDAPAPRSILDGRRSGRRSEGMGAGLSPTASRASDLSRGASEAGDESYSYKNTSSPTVSPTLSTSSKLPSGEEEPGWRKAWRRVSLLGAGAPTSSGSPSDASSS